MILALSIQSIHDSSMLNKSNRVVSHILSYQQTIVVRFTRSSPPPYHLVKRFRSFWTSHEMEDNTELHKKDQQSEYS